MVSTDKTKAFGLNRPVSVLSGFLFLCILSFSHPAYSQPVETHWNAAGHPVITSGHGVNTLDSLAFSDIQFLADSLIRSFGSPATARIIIANSQRLKLAGWNLNSSGQSLHQAGMPILLITDASANLTNAANGTGLTTEIEAELLNDSAISHHLHGLRTRTVVANENTTSAYQFVQRIDTTEPNLWNDTFVPLIVTLGAAVIVALFFLIRS